MLLGDDLASSAFGSDFSADDFVVLGQIAPPFEFLIGGISIISCGTPNDW